MKRENKAELVAQITNLFNDGLITAEKRDEMIASIGLPKQKVSKPEVDPEKYGIQVKRGALYFFKGLEQIDMAESERPEYCYFAVYYRGKNDDLPKLVIEFYTNRHLFGIIKKQGDDYVLKRSFMFSENGTVSRESMCAALYSLALLQRNYNAIHAGENISGKGADLVGDKPLDIVLTKQSQNVESTETPVVEETTAPAKTKKSNKK